MAQSVSCAVLGHVNARLATKISVLTRPFVGTFVLAVFVGLVKGGAGSLLGIRFEPGVGSRALHHFSL
jgi:hypothetical protein